MFRMQNRGFNSTKKHFFKYMTSEGFAPNEALKMSMWLFLFLPKTLRKQIMNNRKGHLIFDNLENFIERWWHYELPTHIVPESSKVGTWTRVRVRKRKGRKDWSVFWVEEKSRKSESFPTKILAEHFAHFKYVKLNFYITPSNRNSNRYSGLWK